MFQFSRLQSNSMKKQNVQIKDGLVLFCAVMIMAATMGIVNVVTSLFYPIVSADLGVTRSAFALTGTITALSSMAASLFWGFFFQKHEIQRAMILGIIALGLCFLGFSFSQNIYHFYIVSCVIGLIFGGVSIMPVSIVITRYFTKNTGFALSLALAGSGLGGMVLNPIINNVIYTQSWQAGYRLLAIVVFAIALPGAFLMTHITKEQIKPRPSVQTTSKAEKKSAWGTAWFWAFLLAASLAGVTGVGMLSNLPAYMKDLSFSVNKISLVSFAYAASTVIGKFILGFLYDHLGGKKATVVAGFMKILTMLFLILIRSTPFLIMMLICLGVGISMGTISLTWLTNSFFGKEDYSKYYGSVQFTNSLGIAVGVPLVSLLLESIGNFTQVWLIMAFISAVLLVLLLFSMRGNKKFRSAQILEEIEA
jgi:MFS family permease